MGHYDEFYERDYDAQRKKEIESKIEVSKGALNALEAIKYKVLTSYLRHNCRQPVPEYVNDAFQTIEDFHKAQLWDCL
jgi:hypothetical protein